jgi:hypothetical protein
VKFVKREKFCRKGIERLQKTILTARGEKRGDHKWDSGEKRGRGSANPSAQRNGRKGEREAQHLQLTLYRFQKKFKLAADDRQINCLHSESHFTTIHCFVNLVMVIYRRRSESFRKISSLAGYLRSEISRTSTIENRIK